MPSPAATPAAFPLACAEWPLLRDVLLHPVAAPTLVELPGVAFAARLLEAAGALVPGRTLRSLRFDALRQHPREVLAAAEAALGGPSTAPPSVPPLLALIDETPSAATEPDTPARLAAFWRSLNQHREAWDALPAQTLWLLTAVGYAALNEHGLHFKRWVPLKIHLHLPPPPPSPSSPLDPALAPHRPADPDASSDDTSLSAPSALTLWRTQAEAAEAAGEAAPSITLRYLLPLLRETLAQGRLEQIRALIGEIERRGWPRESEIDVLKALADAYSHIDDIPQLEATTLRLIEHHRSLSQADPQNSTWQRDLSVSLEKLGDIHLAQGRLDLALSSFQQSHDIRQGLAASEPANAESQRDLSVSLDRLGNIHLAQGRLDPALSSFRQSHDICQHLAASAPQNSTCQRDLSVSLERLGDIHLAQGRLDLALSAFQQSLDIRQGLAASAPQNSTWQRDLSVSLNKLGDIHRAQSRLDLALASFQQSLDIRQGLAVSDPKNSEWQRDLQISHQRLGDLLALQGRAAEAEVHFRSALALARRLVALAPDHTRFLSSLISSLGQLADLLAARPEPAAVAEARALLTEAIALHDRLAAAGTFTEQRQLGWGDWLRAHLAALAPAESETPPAG